MDRELARIIVANAMEWGLILLPLAVYLLVLGLGINRQRRPVLITGPRNMLGVLLALSGFLLLGPPSWVAQFFLKYGPKGYWSAYAAYLLVLGLLCWWLIRRQRDRLVIYNIEPALFAEVLEDALRETEVRYSATPGRIALAQGRLVLDIEPSFLLHNVSLRWHGKDESLRRTIEAKLIDALAGVESHFNPAASLLSMFGFILLSFTVFAALLFYWIVM